MKKILSFALLCATILLASCSKDDEQATMISSVSLDKTTLSLVKGATGKLTVTIAPDNASVKDLTWMSCNKAIATVDDKGVVTAVAAGKATITVVTRSGGKSASCEVTVTAASASVPVTSVTLNKTALALVVGGSGALTATVLPEDATNKALTWSSDKPAIATVDANGAVKALADGAAVITVTTKDGAKTATCTVSVTKAEKDSKWATGNLVADGKNGAKIGEPSDNGLYFQFNSLIGWSDIDPLAIAVSPVGYNGSTSWNNSWTGDPSTENVATGTGDPCRYYLKNTWRLPTAEEYDELFKNHGYPSTGPWIWDASSKSATNSTLGLIFPASGYRKNNNGSLTDVGTNGSYWSSSPGNSSTGRYLLFLSSSMKNGSTYRPCGHPVRCIRD